MIAAVPGQPQGDAGPTAGAIAYLQGTRQVRIWEEKMDAQCSKKKHSVSCFRGRRNGAEKKIKAWALPESFTDESLSVSMNW